MFKAVGLIGAGALGQAVLSRLILAGVSVKVYDPSPLACDAALALGATVVESAEKAAHDVDCVQVCVRTDEEVLDAALGSTGALSAMQAGEMLVIHSTVLPVTTRAVGAAAMRQEVAALDAAVIGVPAWIREGNVSFLVGGPPEAAETLQSHLLTIGRAVYYFGPLGSGNMAKLVKNLASAVDRVIMVEVLELAEAGGLDPRQVLDMMRVEYLPLTRDWERTFEIKDEHAVAKPATSLLNKDIGYAADLAAELGLDLPVTRSAAQRAAQWVAAWKRT